MKQLQAIWDEMPLKSDKGNIHSYIPVYEEILAPYRHTAKNILEIGLFNGASMLLWEQYFTNAKVHGIDCDDQPHGGLADLRPMIAEGTHNVHIMDGSSEDQVEKEFGETKWDVVIDDSNHLMVSQIKTVQIFKSKMNKGGIMVIEDPQELDKDRQVYLAMHDNVEIVDLRNVKGRYDDGLIILRF